MKKIPRSGGLAAAELLKQEWHEQALYVEQRPPIAGDQRVRFFQGLESGEE